MGLDTGKIRHTAEPTILPSQQKPESSENLIKKLQSLSDEKAERLFNSLSKEEQEEVTKALLLDIRKNLLKQLHCVNKT